MRKLLLILLLLLPVHVFAELSPNELLDYADPPPHDGGGGGWGWFIFLLCCMALSAFLVLTADFIAWLKKNKPLNFTEKQKEKEELHKQIARENANQANKRYDDGKSVDFRKIDFRKKFMERSREEVKKQLKELRNRKKKF